MSQLIECPHCFTMVFLDTSNRCPCCSKSIYEQPSLSKDEYIRNKEKEDLKLLAIISIRSGVLKVIGGILLLPFSILFLFAGKFSRITGFYVAIPLLVTGYTDIIEYFRLRKKLREEYRF